MSDKERPGASRLGETLISHAALERKNLEHALRIQEKWGTRLGDIIMAKGWVDPADFYRALAAHLDIPFVSLAEQAPDRALFRAEDMEHYCQLLLLPWKKEGKTVWVVTCDPSPAALDFVAERFGSDHKMALVLKSDLLAALKSLGGAHFGQKAIYELAEARPEHSASTVFSVAQLVSVYAAVSAFFVCLVLFPIPTLLFLNACVTFFFVCSFLFKFVLAWVGSGSKTEIRATDEEVRALDELTLPVYTILVPMYREPAVLPVLADALSKLDYPLSKLDIKFVLEEHDHETIEAAKSLNQRHLYEIVLVPDSPLKTKPKACNYALGFARGELVTIFDAEDKPEPDQLKKAVVCFRKGDDALVCVQSRLNYYNRDENWITRMFTMEYSLWFDFMLPALEELGIPVPLGGTSNHFKLAVLRAVNAWDPFNVTEDADLGVRFSQLGYRVAVMNSTTFEEANTHAGNWVRQRSRWLKGYMQTYLVHMRNPLRFYASIGHAGFWGFQFFIGGTFLTVLLTPWVYGMFAYWLVTRTGFFDPIFPPVVLVTNLFNLLAANCFFVYASMLGVFKRKYYQLIPYSITVPAYWLMMSIAGYKALWQLLVNPYYWEKTVHGLSAEFKPKQMRGGA